MAQVEGRELLAVSRAEIWGLLNDPEALSAAIPGCGEVYEEEVEDERRFRAALSLSIGGVRGLYDGTLSYVGAPAEPGRCRVRVAGSGERGTLTGEGLIDLLPGPGGGTEVAFEGDFRLTGSIAGTGQRLAPAVIRRLIVRTLRNLEIRAQEGAPGVGAGAASTNGSGPASLPRGAWATGPAPDGEDGPGLAVGALATLAGVAAIGATLLLRRRRDDA